MTFPGLETISSWIQLVKFGFHWASGRVVGVQTGWIRTTLNLTCIYFMVLYRVGFVGSKHPTCSWPAWRKIKNKNEAFVCFSCACSPSLLRLPSSKFFLKRRMFLYCFYYVKKKIFNRSYNYFILLLISITITVVNVSIYSYYIYDHRLVRFFLAQHKPDPHSDLALEMQHKQIPWVLYLLCKSWPFVHKIHHGSLA